MNRFRELISSHPRITLAGAIVLPVLIFLIMSPQDRPNVQFISMAYYFDQNTNQLVELPADSSNPAQTESGRYEGEPAGVMAHVFSCGSCSGQEQFIGWLEKPVQRSSPRGVDTSSLEEDDEPSATLVRRVADVAWVRRNSKEGARIVESIHERCSENQSIRFCSPPMKAK